MTELEPLLKRIELLTPYFGRAQDDLLALATRGRNRDYKGVLQNARLVLEMLLRSLITTELKQTPGKATLDELLNKFRQQANAGLIPTHVLAHMSTVQAWGNLSAHDHAGDLHDPGVKVALQEAVTSLSSLVAILSWYQERYAQEPAAAAIVPATPGTPTVHAPEVRPPGSRRPMSRRLALVGGAGLVALAAGLGVLAYRPMTDASSSASASSARDKVDALYGENAEPPPPVDCQETDPRALVVLLEMGPKLSERVPEKDREREASAALPALRMRSPNWGPEGWFHVAKASLLARHPDAEAMNKALLCTNFAAAENLAGRMAVANQNLKEAVERFTRASELDARFWKPRYNLGFLYLKLPRTEQAVSWLERAVESAPNVAEIHLKLGEAYAMRAREAQDSGHAQEATADLQRAQSAWCQAKKLGHPEAATLCSP
ncbi:tetratricopeptide repeat protein [Vitiosangium sp. GDMCC 1.1324]|uniref:tetratricopeptide repeat protein n=1 Tax=Vitiosangium sp. (strain GDMCC 1.1324) TaxID=2138576 RepID=UPI000D370DAE|nr:tetratricopeptide repeat protein [Vitiosangium sp. GDMCC 1.1324]PTL78015.1 hypothetical protein DAT35_41055 [Vitiosangium sp. GDMCC 1.1324]